MIEDFCRRRSVVARIHASRFLPDLEALATFDDGGHRHKTLTAYLYGAAHLVSCIERGEIPLSGLTAERLQRGAREHRERCFCPRPNYLGSNFVSVAPHLFEVIRERHGLASSPAPPPTPLDAVLQLFDRHLRDERGLVEATRERYLRNCASAERKVRQRRYRSVPLDGTGVRDFVADRAAFSLHAARVLGVALRGFLRFLTLRGEPVGHLVAAVPTTSRSRLSAFHAACPSSS